MQEIFPMSLNTGRDGSRIILEVTILVFKFFFSRFVALNNSHSHLHITLCTVWDIFLQMMGQVIK